jgi:hypothetical protein
MAFLFVENHGNSQNKTSASTLAHAPASQIPAGAVVVVRTAWNNAGTSDAETSQLSCSDSKGNIWTKIREVTKGSAGAGAGVCAASFFSLLTTALETSDSITVTSTSAQTAKDMHVEEYSVAVGSVVVLETSSVGTGFNTTPSASVSGLASREYLFVGHVGVERSDDGTWSQDADYLPSTGFLSFTSGAGQETNVTDVRGYRIATLTGDTYNPSKSSTNVDWAAILGVIREVAGFPAVQTRSQSSVGSSSTSHIVTLPTGIVSGDLIVILFAIRDDAVLTWPGGWTEVGGALNNRFHLAFKRSTGGEPASITVTSNEAKRSDHHGWRISGHHATSDPEWTKFSGSFSGNPNPPNHAASWGTAEKVLWLAGYGSDTAGAATAYPTNYTNGRTSGASAVAERELNAASEDPSTFTFPGGVYLAGTVAIRPVAVAVEDRRGQVSWGELETPAEPRRGQAAWAELETPSEPRRGLTSWLELEIPDAPRRAQTAWAELEAPDEPRRGQVTWAELETPDVTAEDRRALAAWVELEVPNEPRRAQTAWAELETPNEPRRGLVTWAEIETPSEPRRGLTSWSELEVPGEPRRGAVSWAEFELSDVVEALRERWGSLYL